MGAGLGAGLGAPQQGCYVSVPAQGVRVFSSRGPAESPEGLVVSLRWPEPRQVASGAQVRIQGFQAALLSLKQQDIKVKGCRDKRANMHIQLLIRYTFTTITR